MSIDPEYMNNTLNSDLGTRDTEDPQFDALLRQLARDPDSRLGDNRLISGTTLLAGRFTIVRTLGEGGMGVVYEAFDAEKRCRVAIKTLPKAEPAGLYRFKNEFRLLAEIQHPNLIHLHELVADGGLWFFTMELIQGEAFSRWVRPGGQLDEDRLRSATRQLCAGLAAAHERGRLHRDLKPSNILVSQDARVAVLDFGLTTEPEPGGVGQTIPTHAVLGTPDYMAPEQAAGLPATAASDCYSLGVILFEALVGRLPFAGRSGEVLAAKQRDDPPSVALVAPEAPADLAALCDELLRRHPEARPGLNAVLRRLGPTSEDPSSVKPAPSTRRLIGREQELRALHDAYRDTLAGQPVVFTIRGESGIGKSSLCAAFLDALRKEKAAVLLAGECRERETVPFKALDTLIDELSRYLRRLPTDQAAALLPREVFALRTLFPVLARVDAVAAMPGRVRCGAQELRRLAFSALGELLARLRDQEPLVVCIDDLQWIDADSVALLRHLLVDRSLPACLLVLMHREEGTQNELLAEVLDAAASNTQLLRRDLELGPLALPDTERLAMAMLGEEGPAARDLCAGIARESAGIPFWTGELARFVLTSVDKTVHEAPSLSSALLTRIKLLSATAQCALELLALVGQPVPLDLLLETSGSSTDDIDALRMAHLVRGRRHRGTLLLEYYHDRIREIVSTSLSEERRAQHYRVFASLLIAHDGANPELISTCLERIGDRRRAAHYAVVAAAEAAVPLAFDRAASLYARALALWRFDGPEKRDLLVKLGTAYEQAGRGRDAAAAYRQAAASSDSRQEVELRRRAAEQLLATGHLDEGLALLREVCRDVRCSAVWNERSALLSYLWNRFRMHFAALDRSPHVERASDGDRLRLQTSKTLVTGLIGYFPIQTVSNASRYLLMALECGERADWIRALGFQAHIQTLIEPSAPFASRLLERMEELADQSDSPADAGFASLMRGTSAYHGGRYRIARQHLASALSVLRGCSGVDWEMDCANIYDQLSASDSGDYADIARNTPSLIEEALRRGRVWAAAMLSGFGVHAWLIPDNAPGYGFVLAEAKKQWRAAATPRWPDFVLLVGESQQLVYSGRPAEAFGLFEAELERYANSGIMRSGGRGIGGFAAHHGRAAAAALRSPNTDPRHLPRMQSVIRSSIRLLSSGEGPKRKGIAGTLKAALLCATGAPREAHSTLVAAADALETAGVAMLAAAARRRAGQLLGGLRGKEMIAQGEAFMLAQGARNVEAMTEVSCPGCFV